MPWLIALALLAGAQSETVPSDYVRSELVLWPVIPKSRGCGPYAPNEVLVREAGRWAEVVDVSAETRPVVHALLIDDSLSVLEWRKTLERSVRRYIVAAPDRDTLVVRHMSETEPLEIPPGGDFAEVEAQLTRIQESEPADQTKLRDSLLATIETLMERPGRRVLVVVTDGFDTASRLPHGSPVLLEAASGIPDLAVHVALIARAKSALPDDGEMLRELARSTGGRAVDVYAKVDLIRFLGRLRGRLERELIVAYKPPAMLEDEPPNSLREVSIEWAGDIRCALESTRPLERRLEAQPGPP